MMKTSIKITSEKLDPEECYRFVADDSCGGIAAFICVVRNDTLKERVPIWKKEYFSDGEVWVNAHP